MGAATDLRAPFDELDLADAAIAIGASRERALRLVFRGVIRGRRRDGKWVCDAESVRALIRQRVPSTLDVKAS